MTAEVGVIGAEDDARGFWRLAASFLNRGLEPDKVLFQVRGDAPDRFAGATLTSTEICASVPPRYDRDATALINRVLLFRDSARFALSYRLLWRLRERPELLQIASDPDVLAARMMEKAIRRDMHKMTAFVRFRAIERDGDDPIYVAWFEPSHFVVAATAPFFRDRFASMQWSILTPDRSAHWNGTRLALSPGARREDAPGGDPLETLWRTYYAHIFNPARLMPKAMTAQMPKKYWHNLPEAQLIAPLIASARKRAAEMVDAPPTVPDRRIVPYATTVPTAAGLISEIATCTRCQLHCHATQAVPGEGPEGARLFIVGEQPGHEEDLAGKPFVGPAGRLLNIALERAGISREHCYVTNAVKHFKYIARGKKRIHKSPSVREIDHCRWWIERELDLVRPDLTLALGGTAVRSLVGQSIKLSEVRSRFMPFAGGTMLATSHPSFLLRLRDEREKREHWFKFLSDLRMAHAHIQRREAAVAQTV